MIQRFDRYIKESTQLELHYYAFDWDDNILHMPTVIHMDRKVGQNWVPIDVSTSEFAKVRNDKENYRIRNNDPNDAFSEFRDFGPRGNQAFLEDVKKALSEKRYGPSWDSFIDCLTDCALFAIITARGHEPESIRGAVEYIIDNVLSENEQFLMYSNCLKEAYIFGVRDIDNYSRIIRGPLSEMPLIKNYLDNCSYYGVSSDSFAQEFGQSSASNPEKAKELALDKFVETCNEFGHKVGAKSVSVGFSDDDPKNVEHVQAFFKEKSALSYDGPEMKYNVYKTTDPLIKGGIRTKFKEGEKFNETSHQAWGMESSVLPFDKFNNMTQRLYPNTKEAPYDDYAHQIQNRTKMSNELYKEFAYKKKRKK